MNTRAFNRTPVAQAISLILRIHGLWIRYRAGCGPEPENLDEVVVTGIRGSLDSSMSLKRDAQGVVDGIVAEDIGKFPGHEPRRVPAAHQRRVHRPLASAKARNVTVRGVGPDFNLVLLNGRQMPAASIQDTGARTRALSTSPISPRKRSRRSRCTRPAAPTTPTGGIGATINIKTARPLDNPGLHTSFGVKGVMDEFGAQPAGSPAGRFDHAGNLRHLQPHVRRRQVRRRRSSASYQERNSGFNQAAVGNGWRPFAGDEEQLGHDSAAGRRRARKNITNRPGCDRHLLGAAEPRLQRQRHRAQAHQRPAGAAVASGRLAHRDARLHLLREQDPDRSATSCRCGSTSVRRPAAGPTVRWRARSSTPRPIPAAQPAICRWAAPSSPPRTRTIRLGFNLGWEATDRSASSSTTTTRPLNPAPTVRTARTPCSASPASYAAPPRRTSRRLPGHQRGAAGWPGRHRPVADDGHRLGFRNGYMKMEIEQAQLDGNFDFTDNSRLDFGVALTEVKNRSAFSNVQNDTWGSASRPTPATYPDDVWQPDTVRQYFDQISRQQQPEPVQPVLHLRLRTVRATSPPAALATRPLQRAATTSPRDRRVKEESQSAYVQFSQAWDTGDADACGARRALREDRRDVERAGAAPPPASAGSANNEFNHRSVRESRLHHARRRLRLRAAELDFDVGLMRQPEVARQLGQDHRPPGLGRHPGRTDARPAGARRRRHRPQGNPALKPLSRPTIDLSLEWYYAEGSYAVGRLLQQGHRQLRRRQHHDRRQPFDLHTPVGGARTTTKRWRRVDVRQADLTCIRNYIFDNHAGAPGVTATGADSNGPHRHHRGPAGRSDRRPSASRCRRTSAVGAARRLGIQHPAHVRRQRLRRRRRTTRWSTRA